MKIIAFHIQNFKSIVDSKIYLDSTLSVLTGENNCGKTTVIEALALWVECFEKLLISHMKETTKISKDGVVAAAEFLRLFVIGSFHCSFIYSNRSSP